ncbi:hypothetical protein EON83_14570 [bacterium]|nr:MAG: hypothetical protein EON83_14570 [bacterium]
MQPDTRKNADEEESGPGGAKDDRYTNELYHQGRYVDQPTQKISGEFVGVEVGVPNAWLLGRFDFTHGLFKKISIETDVAILI